MNADVFGNKTDSVQLCPLQTPHVLTRHRVGTSAVTDRLPVTKTILRPYLGVFRLPPFCCSGLQSSEMLSGKYWKLVTHFGGGGISVPLSCQIVKEECDCLDIEYRKYVVPKRRYRTANTQRPTSQTSESLQFYFDQSSIFET